MDNLVYTDRGDLQILIDRFREGRQLDDCDLADFQVITRTLEALESQHPLPISTETMRLILEIAAKLAVDGDQIDDKDIEIVEPYFTRIYYALCTEGLAEGVLRRLDIELAP